LTSSSSRNIRRSASLSALIGSTPAATNARHSSGVARTRTIRPRLGAFATNAFNFIRSASGIGPVPSHVNCDARPAPTHGTRPAGAPASRSAGRPSIAAYRTARFAIASRSQFPRTTTVTAFTSVVPSRVTVGMPADPSRTFARAASVAFASVFTSISRKNGGPPANTVPRFTVARGAGRGRAPGASAPP
jgi:hypothetical protein